MKLLIGPFERAEQSASEVHGRFLRLARSMNLEGPARLIDLPHFGPGFLERGPMARERQLMDVDTAVAYGGRDLPAAPAASVIRNQAAETPGKREHRRPRVLQSLAVEVR